MHPAVTIRVRGIPAKRIYKRLLAIFFSPSPLTYKLAPVNTSGVRWVLPMGQKLQWYRCECCVFQNTKLLEAIFCPPGF